MCGIMGYIGSDKAEEVILEGLKTLEYRGYDSAGIAVLSNNEISIVKTEGKIRRLAQKINDHHFENCHTGIGHTRWATHGKPNETNAHPHQSGNFVVIHNGIIENYLTLKEELIAKGVTFTTETDTEVIAHLINHLSPEFNSIVEILCELTRRLEGSYALGVLNKDKPDHLYGIRNGSPLIIGESSEHMLFASDIPALISYTNKLYFLDDMDIFSISLNSVKFYNKEGESITKTPSTVQWTPSMVDKSGYKHYMLKEIFEQSSSAANTINTRIHKDDLSINLDEDGFHTDFTKINRIHIIACGTSYHAGLVGKYIIENDCQIPVEIDLASEFRYRNPVLDKSTLVIPISQSGETADTLASLKICNEKNIPSIAICNVLQSSIPRECNDTLYTLAGPEIGVASTKAFTTQIIALNLLSLAIAQKNNLISEEDRKEKITHLLKLPQLIEKTLGLNEQITDLATHYYQKFNCIYIGRGIQYPIALEGALKLKEISYIHAEGYAAGEMKHGPIALIDEDLPTFAVCLKDNSYLKMVANIEEIRSRKGEIIIVATEGDEQIKHYSDNILYIPECAWEVSPILASIPLQLLAYHIASLKGTDVDQPRNLAKSVTVE